MTARLSSPADALRDHYEVVVVGSGYGGAIAASRLARAGRQVCLLERGKELQPGEYPDTGPEVLAEFQIDSPQGRVGSRTALYDMRVNDDLSVFVGCGLGGTSLVNANVSLRADPRVFQDPCWPQGVRDDLDTLVRDGYQRAEQMLAPVELPDTMPTPKKLEALAASAARVPGTFRRLPVNVTFQDRVNEVGVHQRACSQCGDCVSGCNQGAKNTVLMNYLPDARHHGAEIFTRVCVRSLERRGDRWLVHYQLLDTGRERFDAPPLFMTADMVILAAGTLGSTEILLRSKREGLALSDQVGKRITGNGDVLAFSYNSDREINSVGWGQRFGPDVEPVGPCITGVIDTRAEGPLDQGMVIEEGVIPGALANFLPRAFAAVAALTGDDTDRGLRDRVAELARQTESIVFGPYRGAVRNTQTYLVMSHDDGNGEARLDGDGRLRIHWPDVGAQPVFDRVSEALRRATEAIGGTYLTSPLWHRRLGERLVTVHPLGGCVMGEDAAQGAVNHKGQVFRGPEGSDVYPDLYVCDGAVMPRSLGVNPLLTISALAERCAVLIAADRGWTIDYTLPRAAHAPQARTAPGGPAGTPPAGRTLGIQFSEAMTGFVSGDVGAGYEQAARRGEEEGSPLTFTLTISSDDLDGMLADPDCEARMVGTVVAPALSDQPLTVTEGVFNLFVPDPERVGERRMRYRMKLTSEEGAHYYFRGFKRIHDDPGADIWADTTTLYVTVHKGADEQAPVLAKGILRIRPRDFLTQLTTMEVRGADGVAERLEALSRFGRFFGGALFDTFGGVVGPVQRFDVSAPARKKRPLRVSTPEVHPVVTADGVTLRLTRYQGGGRGPVLLTHGLGVSSRIFSADTIETNLVEFLHAHEYDVWLLDYRSSIDLPSAHTRSTGDQVAASDYPAAVEAVRALTGSTTVQVVAHCYGGTTFLMAMLAGLQGVRSAVVSQVGLHVLAPTARRLRAGLHVPGLLDLLGVESMNAMADSTSGWASRLYDRFLSLFPQEREERCRSAVCHRVTFLYSLLYEHDQLNHLTHETLHELFGVANIDALRHLALMVRAGELRRADGSDGYLPHLPRLALPITFLHGAENLCHLPESTLRTVELLAERNGAELYRRHVIPDYGHLDCVIGKNAAQDVYPHILEHLERTQ